LRDCGSGRLACLGGWGIAHAETCISWSRGKAGLWKLVDSKFWFLIAMSHGLKLVFVITCSQSNPSRYRHWQIASQKMDGLGFGCGPLGRIKFPVSPRLFKWPACGTQISWLWFDQSLGWFPTADPSAWLPSSDLSAFSSCKHFANCTENWLKTLRCWVGRYLFMVALLKSLSVKGGEHYWIWMQPWVWLGRCRQRFVGPSPAYLLAARVGLGDPFSATGVWGVDVGTGLGHGGVWHSPAGEWVRISHPTKRIAVWSIDVINWNPKHVFLPALFILFGQKCPTMLNLSIPLPQGGQDLAIE